LINPQRKICKKTELLSITLSLNFTLKCNTASVVPSTPELSKSDQLLTEESELPHKESKEMLLAKLKLNKDDLI